MLIDFFLKLKSQSRKASIRIGQERSRNRSAVKVWDAREYRNRRIDAAMRRACGIR